MRAHASWGGGLAHEHDLISEQCRPDGGKDLIKQTENTRQPTSSRVQHADRQPRELLVRDLEAGAAEPISKPAASEESNVSIAEHTTLVVVE